MGMGRNSSRIATRRIANYNGDELDQLIEATGYVTSSRSSAAVAASKIPALTHDDELMSIINAVASNLPPNNSLLATGNLKPPTAKKKRIQKSTSSLVSANATAQTTFNTNSSSSSYSSTSSSSSSLLSTVLANPSLLNSDSNSNSNQTNNSN